MSITASARASCSDEREQTFRHWVCHALNGWLRTFPAYREGRSEILKVRCARRKLFWEVFGQGFDSPRIHKKYCRKGYIFCSIFFIQVADLVYHWMYNSPVARYTFVYHHASACISSPKVYSSATWWYTRLRRDWDARIRKSIELLIKIWYNSKKRWYYVKKLFAYIFRTACNRYWIDVSKYKSTFKYIVPNSKKFKQCSC